jgi:hypothetical protein
MCGIAFGLGAATKWIALYAAAGVAFVFFAARAREIYAIHSGGAADRAILPPSAGRRGAGGGKAGGSRVASGGLGSFAGASGRRGGGSSRTSLVESHARQAALRRYAKRLGVVLAACVVLFIVAPGVIYLLSYIPYTQAPGAQSSVWRAMMNNQRDMYGYHSALTDTHPFESPWWSWPIMTKPIWFYSASGLPAGIKASISSFGNPLVWWVGIPCLIFAAYQTIKRRDGRMAIVLVGFLFQYSPWVLITRAAFIYHYFSALPFVIFSIAFTLKYLVEERIIPRVVVVAYLASAAALFVVYYPVLSGTPASADYLDSLKLFSTWYW